MSLALSMAAAALPRAHFETLIEQPALPQTEEPPVIAPEVLCTADKRWCMQLSHDVHLNTFSFHIFDGRKPLDENGERTRVLSYPLGNAAQSAGPETSRFALWSQIIREPSTEKVRDGDAPAESIIFGVRAISTAMYSGGRGSAETLTLHRLEYPPYSKPPLQEILRVPLSANLLIRSCFSEEDYKSRLGACHDQYRFDAAFSLDHTAKRASPPQLVYETKAMATPGNSRRMEDNLEKGRLTEADLKPRADPKCSYRRLVTYNPVTGRYEFDQPGPECSDYTTP